MIIYRKTTSKLAMSNTESSCGSSGANLSTSDHYPNDTDDRTAATLSPKPKRKKYYQTYRKKWEEEMSWITHSRKGDRYAYCKVCLVVRGG